MPRLKFLLIPFVLLACADVHAQDEHFSLFHRAPLHYNPALTGISQYELRGGINYRSQWASIDKAFTTMSAYADKSVKFGADRVAGGLIFMNDRTGPGRLNTSKMKLSAAYHKRIGRHFITGALQPGFIFRRINNPSMPGDYDPSTGGFNPAANADALNKFSFDIGLGAAYQYKSDNWKAGVGQSILHLNQPSESLLGHAEETLSMRWVTSLWGETAVGPGSIHPRAIVMKQNNITEAILAIDYRQTIEGEPYGSATLSGGLALRNNFRGADDRPIPKSTDALSILFGVGWENYLLDFAYDLNISDLHEASGYRGGFELALTYRMGLIPNMNKIAVPCIRY